MLSVLLITSISILLAASLFGIQLVDVLFLTWDVTLFVDVQEPVDKALFE